MTTDKFLENFIKEEYPKAGKIRRWWERKKMNVWLKLPTGIGSETNEDFVKQIDDRYL